jgi:ribose 1,5-bisphosphokinase
MSGVFVCVVGPSGAGKDTLIRYAETRLGQRDDVLFVRRLVTRAPGDFEDHDSLNEAEFADGLAGKRFALAWRAHGHGYAVPLSALTAVRNGAIAVCNLSRGAVAEAERVFGSVVAVLVTAPAEVIATRLAARGRESFATIEARLKREAEQSDFSPAHGIVNDGPVAAAGAALVAIIEQLQSGRSRAPAAADLKAM